jgi:hypothetical protein
MRKAIPLRCLTFLLIYGLGVLTIGCTQTADSKERDIQEDIQAQLSAKMGLPSVKNGAEMRLMNRIIEQRDQNKATYTYVWCTMQGKFRFVGNTVGFPVPYATQRTNPMKASSNGYALPQADPSGLFYPASAEGTWILMKDPNGKDVDPQYFEERMNTLTFKLPPRLVIQD